MVFCNRCGVKADTLYKNQILEMQVCKECRDSFDSWLDMRNVPTETHIESVKSVAEAKMIMDNEGYIFYKKPEMWGQKNKNKGKKE